MDHLINGNEDDDSISTPCFIRTDCDFEDIIQKDAMQSHKFANSNENKQPLFEEEDEVYDSELEDLEDDIIEIEESQTNDREYDDSESESESAEKSEFFEINDEQNVSLDYDEVIRNSSHVNSAHDLSFPTISTKNRPRIISDVFHDPFSIIDSPDELSIQSISRNSIEDLSSSVNQDSLRHSNVRMVEESENDDDSDKDKSYNPESEQSSDDDDWKYRKKNSRNSSMNTTADTSLNKLPGFDESFTRGAPDTTDMYVDTSDRRIRKQNFCVYCKKFQSVISRHLELVHKNEAAVQAFIKYNKGHPERVQIISRLRKEGDHLFDTSPEYNDGQLLIVYRSNSKFHRKASDYIPCHNCKGRYSSKTIRHHRRLCLQKNSTSTRVNAILSRKASGMVHVEASRTFADIVFPVLRNDAITQVIRYDYLLVKFGGALADKYKKQNQHDMIRARLRMFARLIQELRRKNANIEDAQSIYFARNYDVLIEAVNEVAELDNNTGKHAKPTVALELGTYIKKIGDFLIVECIKKGDHERKKEVKDFLQVHHLEFHVKIARHAVEAQADKTRERKQPLPTIEDIQKLWNYLCERSRNAMKTLHKKFSLKYWEILVETTLLKIQLFNRKRAGELERIELKNLENRESICEKGDPKLYQSLTPEQKLQVNEYVRFQIVGKLGRQVPVLLSKDTNECVQMIIHYRSCAEIPVKNKYLFGMPGDLGSQRDKFLRSCAVMRKYSKLCGAEHPERLRGTFLRKHMATNCAAQNVEENQIFDIANFMGHSESIHRSHYRQSVPTRDLCTVSKFLETALGMETTVRDDEPAPINDQYCSENAISQDSFNDTQTSARYSGNSNYSSQEKESVINSHESLKLAKKKRKKRQTMSESDNSIDESPIMKKPRWTKSDKEEASKTFKHQIENDMILQNQDIDKFLKSNPHIIRTKAQIRTWVSNERKSFRLNSEKSVASSAKRVYVGKPKAKKQRKNY